MISTITHSGFETILSGEITGFRNGDFHHQFYHLYFECNYGNEGVPLDIISGTFHNGSAETFERIREWKKWIYLK